MFGLWKFVLYLLPKLSNVWNLKAGYGIGKQNSSRNFRNWGPSIARERSESHRKIVIRSAIDSTRRTARDFAGLESQKNTGCSRTAQTLRRANDCCGGTPRLNAQALLMHPPNMFCQSTSAGSIAPTNDPRPA